MYVLGVMIAELIHQDLQLVDGEVDVALAKQVPLKTSLCSLSPLSALDSKGRVAQIAMAEEQNSE